MTKQNVGAMLVGLLVSIGASVASCSFPTYNITVTTGSGGGSSSGSGNGGGGAGATASSGSAGGGGASSTSTTSSTSTSSSTGTGVPCVSDGGPCDCDDDKALAKTCGGGTDCNDHDTLVHPGQATFFKSKIVGSANDFDYDCNGMEKYELEGVLDCTNGLACDTTTLKWKTKVPGCGETGQIGKCLIPSALACAESLQGMQVQGCH